MAKRLKIFENVVEMFSKNRHSHSGMGHFLFSINALEAVVAAVLRRPNMAKTDAAVSVEIGDLSGSVKTQTQNPNPKIEYAEVDFSGGVFTIPDDLKAIGAKGHPNLESLAQPFELRNTAF